MPCSCRNRSNRPGLQSEQKPLLSPKQPVRFRFGLLLQMAQLAHAAAPLALWYFPRGHGRQAIAVDAAEYLPAAHGVHAVAPSRIPVFVTEPAAHAVHAGSVERGEYWPGRQLTQFVAPVPLPFCVIEPAWQLALYV